MLSMGFCSNYGVFALIDFKKVLREAGLRYKVVYLDRGDELCFNVNIPS
jgi:hypothetical protein